MKKNKFPIFKCKNREEEFYHVFCKRIKEDLKNILGNNLPTKFKALEVAPTWQESQFLNGYYDGGYKVENSNLYSNNVIYLQKKNVEDCKKGNVYFWEMEGDIVETMDEVYSEWSFLLTGYDIRGYLTKDELDSINKKIIPEEIGSAIKRLKSEIKCKHFYFGTVKRKNDKIVEGRGFCI